MRLAFVAALQLLPPRQRAVLILRDVLAWSAAEVAALLGLSVVAVNSALQRARSHLPADTDSLVPPSEQRQRELLDRYVAAFQNADVDELVAVLTEDARYEMPPFITWLDGSAAIGAFLGSRMRGFGRTPVIMHVGQWATGGCAVSLDCRRAASSARPTRAHHRATRRRPHRGIHGHRRAGALRPTRVRLTHG
jgi:limonene-1,2-epoxide hydrolase